MKPLQGDFRVLHDLRVGEAYDPPTLTRDEVLPFDEIIKVAPLLELSESIDFKRELARAFQSEIQEIRPDFVLRPDDTHTLVTEERGQNFANKLNLQEVVRLLDFCLGSERVLKIRVSTEKHIRAPGGRLDGFDDVARKLQLALRAFTVVIERKLVAELGH